ncbi:hypothetical protein WDU94_011936 [Cyamophila willieti]
MYQIRDISSQVHPSNIIFSILGLHYYHDNQIPIYYKLYNFVYILGFVSTTLYNLIDDNTEMMALYNNTIIIPLICYYLLHMINICLFISLYINTYVNHFKIKKLYNKLNRIDFLLNTCGIQVKHNNKKIIAKVMLVIAGTIGVDLVFYYLGLQYNNLLMNYINLSVLITLHYIIYLLIHFIYDRFHYINKYISQYIRGTNDNANILFPHCNVNTLSLHINTESKHKSHAESSHHLNVESLLNDYKMNIKTYEYIHQEIEETHKQKAKESEQLFRHNPILNPAVLNTWMKKAANPTNLNPAAGALNIRDVGNNNIFSYSLLPVLSTFNYQLKKIQDKRCNRIKPNTNKIVNVTEVNRPVPNVSNLKIIILIHNSLYRLCVSINKMYNRLILLLLIDHFVALIYKLYFPTYLIIMTKNYDYVLLIHSMYWILIRLGLLFVLIYMFHQTQYEANLTCDLSHTILLQESFLELNFFMEQMTKQVRRHKVSFTSYGIFALDYSLLYSIVGTIATYWAIFVQLQLSS